MVKFGISHTSVLLYTAAEKKIAGQCKNRAELQAQATVADGLASTDAACEQLQVAVVV
jgi:hypothetical protein